VKPNTFISFSQLTKPIPNSVDFVSFIHEPEAMADSSSNLKSEAIIDLMKQHFSTDAGKELVKKIGLVYQFQIAPKVPFSSNNNLFSF
jgi:hypothetical protein